MKRITIATLVLSIGALHFIQPASAAPMDWPNWRGPDQNGTSREVGLIDSWDDRSNKNVLWKREDLGTRSTPIVMNGKLYMLAPSELGTPREAERVLCLDAATGKNIWEQRFNVYLSDAPAERAGWSCVTGDPQTGNVYALGVCGLFQCLDGNTGEVIWKYALHEEFGLLSTYGGRTNVPKVFGDLVIISAIVIGWGDMARPAHRFMAFNKRTGEMVWFNGTRPLPYDTTYSTPTIAMLGNQMAMVFGSGDGAVWALQPRTGKQIWKYQLSRAAGLNVSPLVVGNTIYTSHSEENVTDNSMGAVVSFNGGLQGAGLDITKTGEIWKLKQLVAGKSAPLLIDGRLYVIDDRAKLWIFDAKSGKQIGGAGQPNFKLGTVMRSSPLYADGKIYLCTNGGKWHVLKPSANGVTAIKQGRRTYLRLKGSSYASPIVSHGRIYFATTECLYCLGNKDQVPKILPALKPVAELPVAKDAKAAQVQLVPCELVLQPGKKQQFTVRLFNARGQFLREGKANFTIAGGGSITPGGLFSAPKENGHQAAIITAKVGDISGRARVRIIPPLPWKFDFSAGVVPVTWLGMRHRHISLDSNLLQQLRQLDAKNGTRAAPLYEYFTFYFFTKGQPQLKFDDRLPRKPWTGLLKYLETPAASLPNLAAAQKFFGPSLTLLRQNGMLAQWELTDQGGGLQLTVVRHAGEAKTKNTEAMYKLDSIPIPGRTTKLGTRSRGWIGPASLHDYTIEADVMAAAKPGRGIGEIGLIAQGYTFTVLGGAGQLQIRKWSTQLRIAKVVKFVIKPDVWYRMKFSAANVGETAVLQGKIWPRDEPEPKAWMLVAKDPSPNRSGSPGFFGTAREPGSPFYIDNVEVK